VPSLALFILILDRVPLLLTAICVLLSLHRGTTFGRVPFAGFDHYRKSLRSHLTARERLPCAIGIEDG